jgi:hypothetical protein
MRSKKICLQREIQGFNLTKGATAPELWDPNWRGAHYVRCAGREGHALS